MAYGLSQNSTRVARNPTHTCDWGSAHLGQLLLQMTAFTAQCKELLLQRLPDLLSGTERALQALPLHLLLQSQLLQSFLLL